MEQANEIKNQILEAKNICLIPNDNEPESLACSLALFYTLKELNKNVNLIVDELPKKLNFLTPSIDFISSPKNFVISVPRSSADVSQIYYEKNEDSLKIHLTVDKGQIKKENLSFYFEDAKPDLIITLGIQDFQKQLSEKLNSFGFLLGSAILNLDNNQDNKRFGGINIIEEKSIAEIVLEIQKTIAEGQLNPGAANCLLTGLTIYYENFKSEKTNPGVFETAAELIKKGASNKLISDNLNSTTNIEANLLGKILQNIKIEEGFQISLIQDDNSFEGLSKESAGQLVEKIKAVGIQNNLLVLWKKNSPSPTINGFFYSASNEALDRLAKDYQIISKNHWLFLAINNSDLNLTKEKIINLLKERKTNISIYAESLK